MNKNKFKLKDFLEMASSLQRVLEKNKYVVKENDIIELGIKKLADNEQFVLVTLPYGDLKLWVNSKYLTDKEVH